LKLVVTDGGDNYYWDHADWADAKLTSASTPTPPPPSDGVVYLSDLNPVSASNGWGPYERDRENGDLASGDGAVITLNGVTYAKGLGVNSTAQLVYDLGGNYTRFTSAVGVDDSMAKQGTGGSVTFQVWADGTKVYDSGLMRNSDATQTISLDVTGVSQLKLVVTDGGDNYYWDHADWADAKLFV
jgi:hypothetical protein